MSATILTPHVLSPSDLDDYLAKGWRPYGQRIYTADFIQLKLGEIYSVLPTRLDLNTHQWRKGQRKLMRKNNQRFQYTIKPASLDNEKVQINDLYRNQFPDKSVEDLNIHLFHNERKIFNTYELCIYDNECLVAFSFFDLGQQSAYSKVGIYDPSYSKYSLGLYSMYLEIDWLSKQSFLYYYPGYISPETPLFDYKRKVGALECWHFQTKEWQSLVSYEAQALTPLQLINHKVSTLYAALIEAGLKAMVYDYCFFELSLMYQDVAHFLDSPMLIVLHFPKKHSCWIARYNTKYDTYECWQTFYESRANFMEIANRKHPIFRYALQLQQPFIQSRQLNTFIKELQQLFKNKTQLLFSSFDKQI